VTREPIRIRLVPREPNHNRLEPREAFWRAVRQGNDLDQEITSSEGKLCREFGIALRRLLVQELSEPLRSIENTIFRGEFSSLEHFLFRFFERPSSEKYGDRGQVLDAFARMLEQRQQFFRDSPGLVRVQERVAAASSVVFTVRIAGYSSLSLDLSVGSLKSVAAAFDNDFDSFRVFLDAFVPQAFGSVFTNEGADRIESVIQIPAGYSEAFGDAIGPIIGAIPPAAPSLLSQPVGDPKATPRERAEWLWRLANGSLLVPLLLALLVLYLGMTMLKDIQTSQHEAMKPVLEHQLKLLEEDRRRLFREPVTNTQAVTPPATQSK
jgi:hypothetical protein